MPPLSLRKLPRSGSRSVHPATVSPKASCCRSSISPARVRDLSVGGRAAQSDLSLLVDKQPVELNARHGDSATLLKLVVVHGVRLTTPEFSGEHRGSAATEWRSTAAIPGWAAHTPFLPASVPTPPGALYMEVAVLSNSRWFPLAVEREAAVIQEAVAGDESHRCASCVRLMNLKEADPSWLRATMPVANRLSGCFPKCIAAQSEACRKCEIETLRREKQLPRRPTEG